MMIGVATYFISAFALSLVLVPLCRLLALRLRCVAHPKDDRWHKRPTALLGGVAIAVAVLGGVAATGGVASLPVVVLCTSLLFLVGLYDDVKSLKPSTKLVAQIVVASILLYFGGFRLQWVESLTLDAMLTMLWIVGITNAFNLLDNMDGLCAGTAIIAGAALLLSLGPEAASSAEATYLALLLGATAGFLVFNVNPASIFLGDSGSLFIGSSMAVLTLALGQESGGTRNVVSTIAAPAFLLLIPIFDTTLVTLSRLVSGLRPSAGGRDHSSHRLVAIGLSERAAVAVLWTLAAAGGLVGVTVRRVSPDWSGLLAALFFLAMVIFAVYLAHVKVHDRVDEGLISSGRFTVLMTDFMYKRRVAEVLLDLSLVSLAYYAAYRILFEGDAFAQFFPIFLESLPLVVGIQMVALLVVGAYRGVWRYFSLMDAVVFGKSVLFGSLVIVAVIAYAYRFVNYSRGVFVIYAALLMLLLTGSRGSFRLISEFVHRRRRGGRRLAIYGAGKGGQMALRELVSQPDSPYGMVGFIDDDRRTHGTRLEGYPVLGGYDVLTSLIGSGGVDEVVVSTHLIDAFRLRDLEDLCETRRVGLARLHVDFQRLVGARVEPGATVSDGNRVSVSGGRPSWRGPA